jgi:hypothetical protein
MHAVSQDSPSLLKQLFPNPTGNNGWEVVCDVADKLTGDLLKFDELTRANKANISSVSRYFADSRARQLVQFLLDTERMPFVSPRTNVTAETLFPDFAAFRKVVRFVSVAMFHMAGTGRSRDCARLVNVGMRIAIAPAPEFHIGTLVAIACQSILIRQITLIAPLLEAEDLDSISRILHQAVSQRSGYLAAYRVEHRFFINTMTKIETWISDYRPGDSPEAEREIKDFVGNPARWETAKAEAMDFARAELAEILRCIDLPIRFNTNRREPQNPDARMLIDAILPVSTPSLGRLFSNLTVLRMTALYCSAWAFRKRTLTWPARLDDVASKDLCKELVSDQAFVLEQSPGFDAIRIRSAGLPAARGQERQVLTVPELPKSMLG